MTIQEMLYIPVALTFFENTLRSAEETCVWSRSFSNQSLGISSTKFSPIQPHEVISLSNCRYKPPFVVSLCFESISFMVSASIGILGIDISSNVQFVIIWKLKLSWYLKSLMFRIERNSTSCHTTAYDSISRKLRRTSSTVLIFGQMLRNTGFFLLTAYSVERPELIHKNIQH